MIYRGMPWGLSCALIMLMPASSGAQESSPTRSDERLTAMANRAKLLRADLTDRGTAEPLQLIQQPIFRYSDPARMDADGTMWLWTERDRPVAVLCLFEVRPPDAEWNYEFTSLSDRPLRISGGPHWTWTPREQQRTWSEVQHKVSSEAATRLRELRAIAQQFEAAEEWERETYRLRLLPRPVYRYSDNTSGVVDGALFVMAYGTNPELLVQIEARDDPSGTPRWFASFARLGAAALEVERSGRRVWSAERVRSFDPKEPYYVGDAPLDSP